MRARVRALDLEGKPFEIEGEELFSRALQHESDHLIGRLLIDLVGPVKREIIKRKMKKEALEAESSSPDRTRRVATLIVSKIGFEGRHGASAAERQTTRRFEVDVEIDSTSSEAETSDRLADTIDFRDIAEAVVTIGVGEPHHLLESLARRMVNALQARAPGARIRLELRKLSPPYCAGNPAYSGVRITSR